MKDLLQSYIYNEKLLCQLYKRAAAYTDEKDEKDMYFNFSKSCDEAASQLNYFYQEYTGEIYNPVIPDVEFEGSYRDILNAIQKQELSSFLKYRRHTYFPKDMLLCETMRSIADLKLTHTIAVLSIVINMEN